MTMAGLTPNGRKYDGPVTKMNAAWEPVALQMVNDQDVGCVACGTGVHKVVDVYTRRFYVSACSTGTRSDLGAAPLAMSSPSRSPAVEQKCVV